MPASTFSEVLEKLKHIVEKHMDYMDFLAFVLSDQTIYSGGYVFDFGSLEGLRDVVRNLYFAENLTYTCEVVKALFEEWKVYVLSLSEEDFILNNGTVYPVKIFKWEEVYYALRQEQRT